MNHEPFEEYFNSVGLWPNDYFVVPGMPVVWFWVRRNEAYYLAMLSYCVLPQESAK